MPSNEETRKIQFTGKSTYIVSLPKKWVNDLGLKTGRPSFSWAPRNFWFEDNTI